MPTLTFLDEGSPSPVVMEVTDGLAAAVARAAAVSAGKENFQISFTSLLVGLLAAPDETGEWLRGQFGHTNADIAGALRSRGLTVDDLTRLVASGPTIHPQPLARTASARAVLTDAEERARRASTITGTGHLLASFLTLQNFHDDDFLSLGIDRSTWATSFQATQPASVLATDDFDPMRPGVENHVLAALQAANFLAGADLIGARHLITAVISLSAALHSVAFTRAAQLVPLSPGNLPTPEILPDATRFEQDLKRQLARAQRPLPGSTDPSPIWGRDLVTCALLCDDESVGPTVTEAGRSLDMVRDLWYAFVITSHHRPAADWAAWWREADVPLPGPRRAGYATETDEGEDKLGIDAEAQAFSRLILDKEVHAPLSIGLLGDWGSGKSFFIEQIKKGIKQLKQENRPELYSHIVEIEFNAWHASDSNLWASLVTNIFDEIWDHVLPADQTQDPKAAREELRKQIQEARGAVHEAETQVQLGQQALKTAEEDLKQKRAVLAWNAYVRSVAVDKLASLARKAGWHRSLQTINDVEEAARSLAASGTQLHSVASALVERPVLNIAVPTLMLLAVTAAIWLMVDASALSPWASRVTKLLATLSSAVGALALPLGVARQKVAGFSKVLVKIQADYEMTLATVNKSERDALLDARRELESTAASVDAARARLAELLNQQATLDPERRLGVFLEERVQTTQYRSQQGIISLVHKDFSRLSTLMKDLRESSQPQSGPDTAGPDTAGPDKVRKPAIRPFDRIVIYVDDLDRCRPAHVVNMLEAVHLLLALDLFIVVVAVDSRWLTRALEVHYQELLSGADGDDGSGLRSSTPQSYLEKIFQITYALGPMNPEHFGSYVAFLTGDDGKKESRAGNGRKKAIDGSQSTAGGTARDAGGTAGHLSGQQPAGAGQGKGSDHDSGIPESSPRRRPRSAPVHIGKEERAFIGKLVPLLPTPRIAKRLVNVYRVIKAAKPADELEAFEREGRGQTCLLMLAILFGRPSIAGPLLRALHERTPPFDVSDELFVEALRRRVAPRTEPASVQVTWDKLVATLQSIGITETVGSCALEPHEVARYSLVSGHDWHTWNTPPKQAVVPPAGAVTDTAMV